MAQSALEVREANREVKEAKTVISVNGAYVHINKSQVSDFTKILNNSGQKWSAVNQKLWDLLNGVDYAEVEKAVSDYMRETACMFEFTSNVCYAIVGDEDSSKDFKLNKQHAEFGFHEAVINVNTSSHYQNSSFDLLIGFEYE